MRASNTRRAPAIPHDDTGKDLFESRAPEWRSAHLERKLRPKKKRRNGKHRVLAPIQQGVSLPTGDG